MWNRQAWLLLVKLRTGKLHLAVPLSLAVLEEAISALTDFSGVFSPLIRLPKGLKITDLIGVLQELISSIRKYPRTTLVKVVTDEVHIEVSLY